MRRQNRGFAMKTAWMNCRRALFGSIAAGALLVFVAPAFAGSMDKLVAAAKEEGQLTVIALPHDWCGYGALIDGFKTKYGLKVNELNPDAGRATRSRRSRRTRATRARRRPT